ncbi:hypothetical protein [Coprobacter fastidiosus]
MSRETEAAPIILVKLVVKVTIPAEVPTRETLQAFSRILAG